MPSPATQHSALSTEAPPVSSVRDTFVSGQSWRQGITRYQWLVLFIAWLGWVFDAMDATIYAIVLHPALHDLLQSPAKPSLLSKSAGTGDHLLHLSRRLGHRRDFLRRGRGPSWSHEDPDHHDPHLCDLHRTRRAVARLVAPGYLSLSHGTGNRREWAAGAALVAETWPEEKRAKAAGILQSAWAVGFFLAASFNLLLKGYGWRVMFVIGVLPAFVSLLVRWHVKEPDRWAKAHDRDTTIGTTHMTDIFHPPFRRSTIVGSALAFVAVFGLWGATNWAPTLIRELPDLKGSDAATLSTSVSYAIMALNGGALFGYLGFGPLADRFGRRAVFACYVPWQLRDAADHVLCCRRPMPAS